MTYKEPRASLKLVLVEVQQVLLKHAIAAKAENKGLRRVLKTLLFCDSVQSCFQHDIVDVRVLIDATQVLTSWAMVAKHSNKRDKVWSQVEKSRTLGWMWRG